MPTMSNEQNHQRKRMRILGRGLAGVYTAYYPEKALLRRLNASRSASAAPTRAGSPPTSAVGRMR